MNIDLTSFGLSNMYNTMNQKLSNNDNSVIFIILIVIIIVYYVLFSYVGSGTTGENMMSVSNNLSNIGQATTKSTGLKFIEILLWGLFIFLILINGLQYFFDINITASIKNIFSQQPEVDIRIEQPYEEQEEEPIPEIMIEKQVFNIPDNKYTYEDAKALCKAYDAELASYDQIEKAYNDGGEWCNYGWSKDQMIYYPTQKKTYDKLQKIKGHEHNCGRPGINGGYIENPNARFGVNCYGHKPIMDEMEYERMEETTPYPKTKKEKEFEKKVNSYRNKLNNIIVSPFNKNRWSRI